LIEFENVSFGYERSLTIQNVSFVLEKGEFCAIIGENGAGKTTISKLCNGLLKPVSGSVRVGGMDTKTTRTSRIARSVGFLFQNPDRQILPQHHPRGNPLGLDLTVDRPAGPGAPPGGDTRGVRLRRRPQSLLHEPWASAN
jgi:energy-coupling factor transport system ATP-binding protein